MAKSDNRYTRGLKSNTTAGKDASRKGKRDTGIFYGDDPSDVWRVTRLACINAMTKTLDSYRSKHPDEDLPQSSSLIAKSYEEMLHKKYNDSLSGYKLRFRKDLVALKNSKTGFTHDLLFGVMKVEDFIKLEERDLVPQIQKEQDKKLLEDELKMKIGKNLPSDINQIKNNKVFVGEKWGVSESAAKIDPDFDVE